MNKIFGGCFGVLVLASILTFVIWFLGSFNPQVPAGYVGYLNQGAILGQSRFYGLQTGPGSPGRIWMVHTTNISITPYTFTESFDKGSEVLSKDNLQIAFQIHVAFRIKADKVKEFVEHYSTLYDKKDHSDEVVKISYDNFVKEPIRTYARDEVQKLNGLEIKDKISDIGSKIFDRAIKLTGDTPFEISSVVVGNIQYPPIVASAVAENLATTQVLERKKREIEIAEQEKKKRIVDAEGIAEAMRIINGQLSSQYLQHEAIEAQKAMVGSPNHTTIYIPTNPVTGIPMVGNLDLGKK